MAELPYPGGTAHGVGPPLPLDGALVASALKGLRALPLPAVVSSKPGGRQPHLRPVLSRSRCRHRNGPAEASAASSSAP